MIKHTVFLLAAALSAVAFAQEPNPINNPPGQGPVGPDTPITPALSISGELLWTTAYVTDGYVVSDEGLILHPQATIGYEQKISDDLTIAPWFNVWTNITDVTDYPGGRYFDELDLSIGADFITGPFTIGIQYLYFVSPVNSFDDVQKAGLGIQYDDSETTALPVALNPYVTLYSELADANGPEGTYVEIGVQPSYSLKDLPVTISAQIATALNINDYYFDSDGSNTLIGYLRAGLFCQYDFTKNFYISGGVDYYQMISDSTEDSNDGDSNKFVGTVAVGFNF